MVRLTPEEIYKGAERWLVTRRDEFELGSVEWFVIDQLIDELREHGVEGWLPWQRM